MYRRLGRSDMRKNMIAGNWKMNCDTVATEKLLKSLIAALPAEPKADVVVCPPFTSLETAGRLLKDSPISLGAQNMSEKEGGAYTGEVSSSMLLTVGTSFCILGHSERRQYYGETDELVNVKAQRALQAGLKPIICVGETLEDRESGQTEKVLGKQLDGALKGFSADDLKKSVIAYEPVWAIGTGKTATPEMAQAVHRFIRERISGIDKDAAENLPILYGGSMKPGNAKELLAQPDIDGGMIGGAALKADDFVAIINAV